MLLSVLRMAGARVSLVDLEKELASYVRKVDALEKDHVGMEAKLSKARELWRGQAIDWGEKQREKGRLEALSLIVSKDAEIQSLRDQLAQAEHVSAVSLLLDQDRSKTLLVRDFDVFDQHIGVYNPSNEPVSLKGYSLSLRQSGKYFNFPDTIVLPARSGCSVWWGAGRCGLDHPEDLSLHWTLPDKAIADIAVIELLAASGSSSQTVSSAVTNQRGVAKAASSNSSSSSSSSPSPSPSPHGKKRAAKEIEASPSTKRVRASVLTGPRPVLYAIRRSGPLRLGEIVLEGAASPDGGIAAVAVTLRNVSEHVAVTLGGDWRLMLYGRRSGSWGGSTVDFCETLPLSQATKTGNAKSKIKGESQQGQVVEAGARRELHFLLSTPIPAGSVITSAFVVDGTGCALAACWGVVSSAASGAALGNFGFGSIGLGALGGGGQSTQTQVASSSGNDGGSDSGGAGGAPSCCIQ